MLRTVFNPHIKPILRGAKSTVTSTPTATVDIGSGDFTITRGAQGRHSLVPRKPSYRTGPVVATPGADIALGNYTRIQATPTKNLWLPEALNTAGTGDDGTVHTIGLDWDSPYTDVQAPTQGVLNQARSARLIGFKVRSNAITEGKKLATLGVASSVYTFTLNSAFGRSPIVVASSVGTASLRVSAVSASSFAISTADVAGTPTDKDFDVLVLGWDSKDEQWGMRRSVQVPQMKPRLLGFVVTGTGTAAITHGVGDATLTDNGTGDWTLTFAKAFKRAPICIITGQSGRCWLQAAPSTTAVRVLGFAGDGTTATDQVVHVMVLGFDSSVEV